MSDNPHVQYANYQRMHKSKTREGFHSDAKHAERQMIRISNLHKIKTGKHINAHAEALVAHHEKAKEIKRQYVQHSTDLIHAKKAGDKERMERAAKGKAQAEKDHLAHTGEPVHESVEQQREIKQMKTLKEFKEQIQVEETLDEAIGGMTHKQHAEKGRQLRAEIEKHQKAYDEQLAKAHAVRDKLDAAKEAHKKHRELDPKVKARNAEREADGWKHYIEPGRGREPTPSGGMGAR